jgi:hypothetical protein
MDWLITGVAFLWIGEDYEKFSKKAKELAIKAYREYGIEVKESDFNVKQFVDESSEEFRQLVYAPSTTIYVKVNSEGTGVEMYRQIAYHKSRYWTPNQVIHARFMELDGKVNGYTPMEASVPILKTLGLIKDYHGQFFDAGGTPDIIFNFEELGANDPMLLRYEQTIKEWAETKRRGHLVIGAKLNIEKVNEMNKDMEFRLLAIYYTGILAFAFGMPLEKFQMILGAEIKGSTGSSDLGNADYQRNISDMQDYWENLLNTQFWNEAFQVDMVLVRGFLQDQVRKLQVDAQKIPVIQGLINLGAIKADRIPDLINMNFPDIPRDWLEEDPQGVVMERQQIQMDMQNKGKLGQQPSNKVLKEQGSEAYSNEKKSQQNPQKNNNPPSGV